MKIAFLNLILPIVKIGQRSKKPIATHRLSPYYTDTVNQVKAQRADGNTSAFCHNR
jgi:hypothetical protein